MAYSIKSEQLNKLPDMNTLLELDQLHYDYDLACYDKNKEEMASLIDQIKAFENRWSL